MKVKHIILLLVIYLLSGFTGAGAAEVETSTYTVSYHRDI